MISRRRFIGILGGAIALSFVSYQFLARPFLAAFRKEPSSDDWNTLTLLVDEILPKTSTAPSGSEAGVINYMQKALKGNVPGWTASARAVLAGKCIPIGAGYAHLNAHYVRTAERLHTLSIEQFHKTFISLSADERSQIVARFAEGAKADVGYNVLGAPDAAKASDKSLFELIRRHSLEGYFSDPSNGGNKDYVAWESIGHTCHHNYPKEVKGCKKL